MQLTTSRCTRSVIVLNVDTSGEETDTHEETADQSPVFLADSTISDVDLVTNVATKRSSNEVHESTAKMLAMRMSIET